MIELYEPRMDLPYYMTWIRIRANFSFKMNYFLLEQLTNKMREGSKICSKTQLKRVLDDKNNNSHLKGQVPKKYWGTAGMV